MLIMAGPALAQQEKGDTELQFQGSVSLSTKSGKDSTGSVDVNWGRFITERQEAGLTVFTLFINNGDVAGFGGPFWRMNLGTGKMVPYIGASAAASFGDFTTGSALVNLEGGVRWFLARNAAFTLGGLYTYDVSERKFADSVQVLFGFSYLWGK
jgi:hypothetical protein